ncbi:hypothetical protein DB30_03345 [Enhygromyxa salina]|uniref:Uncharacterized protein n=1 Tax=Enhygromyxa salina TaxID=215803 RepID=A0A0C2D2B7_9BACT|nr:hypothetical protein [Enhygromyxa salina]KIG17426.1 hypothetical protein DB30_03345 [Enhygromyxa salina]
MTRTRTCSAAALLLSALAGCGPAPEPEPEPEPIPVTELRPGIVLRGGDYADFDDHLVELIVHEGHVYVANSSLGVAAMRLEDDGGVTLTDAGSLPSTLRRCTSVAVHAKSDTLYCGSDSPMGTDGPVVEVYDISTPGVVTWRGAFDLEKVAIRDLAVVGDQLLIQQFDDGIWTAQIGSEGLLSQLSDTGIVGNARVSVGVGGEVVTLFADPDGHGAQLRLLDPTTWTELDRLALTGPALGLSADAEGGARVAVGLGSGGMALVSVEDHALTLEHTLEPPAVVTTGLLAGDLAIAVTLSGVFAWDFAAASSDGEPRLFGFGPAAMLGHERAGNMLHGVLHEGEVLTSDWLWVERWALDPAGDVLELDVPRGVYVQPEGPVRWRMRNPGPIALRAELWFDRRPVWSGELEAWEVIDVDIPVELRARVLADDEPNTRLIVRVYDPKVPSVGEPVSSTVLVIAQREVDDPMPPATGDVFPTLTLANVDHEIYTMPTPEGSQTIWFWPDCALMWPQLEDLAWLGREGWDLGRGEPIMLGSFDPKQDGFANRWALDGASFGLWGVAAPELGDANDFIDDEDIYMPFFIPTMPGDAMPTDYVMDGQGVILSIERMYRGPWTLAVPWPWTADASP